MTHNRTSTQALQNALASFDEVYTLYDIITNPTEKNIYRDSIIQRFEYTYELAWKIIQKILIEQYGVQDIKEKTKKDLFREAHQRGLIDTVEPWFAYHTARNKTSHTYDEDTSADNTANDIFDSLKDFSHNVDYSVNKIQGLIQ